MGADFRKQSKVNLRPVRLAVKHSWLGGGLQVASSPPLSHSTVATNAYSPPYPRPGLCGKMGGGVAPTSFPPLRRREGVREGSGTTLPRFSGWVSAGPPSLEKKRGKEAGCGQCLVLCLFVGGFFLDFEAVGCVFFFGSYLPASVGTYFRGGVLLAKVGGGAEFPPDVQVSAWAR